jgi:hypothetical protein
MQTIQGINDPCDMLSMGGAGILHRRADRNSPNSMIPRNRSFKLGGCNLSSMSLVTRGARSPSSGGLRYAARSI